MSIPELPKPDLTAFSQFALSIDDTPKVYQRGLVEASEESTDEKENP